MRKLNIFRSFSTVNKNEMKLFDQMSEWWRPSGPMSVLYLYNYYRVIFLKQFLIKQRQVDPFLPLKNMTVLDVGCGAGFLSKSLARLGAEVIGLDPNSTSFKQATEHRNIQQQQFPNLQYINSSLQQYLSTSDGKQFDIVASMDVIQHVDNPKGFIANLSKATKHEGLVMLSSIAKNPMTWLTHIAFAQYITKIVPIGTHSYQKFINPDKLQQILLSQGIKLIAKRQFDVDWRGQFQQTQNGGNYVVIGTKKQLEKPASQEP